MVVVGPRERMSGETVVCGARGETPFVELSRVEAASRDCARRAEEDADE